jgi:hypothetical protein
MGDLWRCLQKEASRRRDVLSPLIGAAQSILAIRMAFIIGADRSGDSSMK